MCSLNNDLIGHGHTNIMIMMIIFSWYPIQDTVIGLVYIVTFMPVFSFWLCAEGLWWMIDNILFAYFTLCYDIIVGADIGYLFYFYLVGLMCYLFVPWSCLLLMGVLGYWYLIHPFWMVIVISLLFCPGPPYWCLH